LSTVSELLTRDHWGGAVVGGKVHKFFEAPCTTLHGPHDPATAVVNKWISALMKSYWNKSLIMTLTLT